VVCRHNYYMKNQTCPDHLIDYKRRALRLKASKYCMIQGGLGWKNLDGMILKCVDNIKAQKLMEELNIGFCGGHHVAQTTTHKILRARYYWPTMLADVHKFVKACQQCQLFTRKQHLVALPFQPVVVEAPFQQWGLDSLEISKKIQADPHSHQLLHQMG
jgi:hypothetical protein